MALTPEQIELAESLSGGISSSSSEDDGVTTYGDRERGQVEPLNDEFDWRTTFRTEMLSRARKWAPALNVSPRAMEAYVRDNFDSLWQLVRPDVIKRQIYTDGDVMAVGDPGSRGPGPREWQIIFDKASKELSIGLGVDLTKLGSGGGGGGGGGGSRGPSAQDIRNMFDEDQLTDQVQRIWGAHMLEDNPNARAIAKQYINTVVAGRGEKEVDFQTFVKNKMRGTSRWNLLYQNKPEGVDEMAYVQPYMQLAQNVVGGNNPGSVAAGGAALGATSEAFQQRLLRTDEHTSSRGFLSGLEDRARSAAKILRG